MSASRGEPLPETFRQPSTGDGSLAIGLCLSGGGFRASLYALGVMRYLAEANLLKDVVAVSAVSGGSILAARLADQADKLKAAGWSHSAFLDHVDRPFRNVVTTENLRNQWLARAPGGRIRRHPVGRGVVLGQLLADRLYETNLMSKLPKGPDVILTTTDLSTGRAFRIARRFIGSFDFGYRPTPDTITVGFAAAASAAVPALFPPASLKTSGLGLMGPPGTLSLVDGGVYDNLGLEWFQGWDSGRPQDAVRPNFLIVANAGGLLRETDHSYGGVRGTWRSKDVQYSQTTRLRIRWFVRDLLAGREAGIYVSSELDPRLYTLPNRKPIDPSLYEGSLPSALVAPLAGLRTDLDRFLPEEANLLSYHAYWSTHARLAALYPQLALKEPAWRDFAVLSSRDLEPWQHFLMRGAKRLRGPRFKRPQL